MSKHPTLDISLNNYSVPHIAAKPRFRKGGYNSTNRFLSKTIVSASAAEEPDPPAFTNTASVLFDGVDERMLVADSSSLEIMGTETCGWSMWINMITGTSGEFFANKTFSTSILSFRGEISTGGRQIRWFIGSTSNFRRSTAGIIPTGSWFHLFVNYDGTQVSSGNRISFFFNGVMDSGTTGGGTVPTTITATTLSNSTYGGITNDGNSLNCYMDEISIWSISSSAAQILSLYNNGVPTNLSGSTGLLHWWRMGDSASFPNIPNEVTGRPTGTLINMESGDITSSVPGA